MSYTFRKPKKKQQQQKLFQSLQLDPSFMAVIIQLWPLLSLLFFFSVLPLSSSQQNIETSFPSGNPPVIPTPNSPNSPPPSKATSNRTVAKAVGATAASTLVIAGVFFFILRYTAARRRRRNEKTETGVPRVEPVVSLGEFKRYDGTVKGLIVDENGLDVLYWRELEGGHSGKTFSNWVLPNPNDEDEEWKIREGNSRMKSEPEPRQEIPLLRGKNSNSSSQMSPELQNFHQIIAPPSDGVALEAVAKPVQPPLEKNRAPPPPLQAGTSAGQTKLEALHMDKVKANTDHSMAWNKINGGSFGPEDNLMESLFGYVATNGKSPVGNKTSTNPSSSNTGPPPQILILDPSKSQNTAIVVRSLTISRKEILDALLNGHVLNSDTLEKLTRIAPTKEEEAQILEFDGNSTKLADAESFLYHLLKAVPSAFTRLDAMLFRSNYDLEIRHFKESLQTLELGCKELRNRGLFLKLVDAILSGNRMNAGTARGNAQAFDLTALQKLSDVKSTDGKTTLLHFVVEEIVRSEGKRCVINRNHSLDRSNSSNLSSGSGTTKEEREKEYIRLGLPVVGGLSLEFFNIKKAATIDCDAFINTCSTLTTRLAKIRQSMARCGSEGGRFLREMKAFLEEAEKELKVVRQEQTKVMELVKRTGEYYPSGASKDRGANPLQLFVIIRDFLGMVDQVFVDVARNLQKRKTGAESGGLSSPYSPATRIPVKSPDLTAHFTSDKSMTSTSSDSEDGF